MAQTARMGIGFEMALDKSSDTLVLLDAYLETAMALVGLARMAHNSEGVDQIISHVRRAYETAGGILQQVADSEAQRELCSKHATLAGMLGQIANHQAAKQID